MFSDTVQPLAQALTIGNDIRKFAASFAVFNALQRRKRPAIQYLVVVCYLLGFDALNLNEGA